MAEGKKVRLVNIGCTGMLPCLAVFLMGIRTVNVDRTMRHVGEVLIWLVLLLGVICVFGVFIWKLRRNLTESGKSQSSSPGLTLDDVHRLKSDGAMTNTEFHVVREIIVGQSMAEMLKSGTPSVQNMSEPSAEADTEIINNESTEDDNE
jgi:hypothetical protein